MGLNLHADCRRHLASVIRELLPQVTVEYNLTPNMLAAEELLRIERILPQSNQFRSKLNEYVGELPVSWFLHNFLTKEIQANNEFDPKAACVALTRLVGFEELDIVAERFVAEFDSLPWRYKLSVPVTSELGKLLTDSNSEISVGPSVALVTAGGDFGLQFPLTSTVHLRETSSGSLLNDMLMFEAPSWDEESAVIQIEIFGFIAELGNSRPLETANAMLHAFYGIALALKVLRLRSNLLTAGPRLHGVVHRREGESWEPVRRHVLPSHTSDMIRVMAVGSNPENLRYDTREMHQIVGQIELIGRVFAAGQAGNKIVSAAEWYFNSLHGTNELLSFVQAIVAMEILLGDKATSDIMGLGELLRNRCAYLIGSTAREREVILRRFKEIYDVRSQIVHRGKSRLSAHERALLDQLRRLCRAVIQKEVQLLVGDR